MTEATSGCAPARWVHDEYDAGALARRVLDPARETPIVCITTPGYLSRPMLDPDQLVTELSDLDVEVWVITQRTHGWALTEELPPGLDVYGGATRLWWPIEDRRDVDPREHPRFAIFSPDDVDRVIREIAGQLRRRLGAPPPEGAEAVGVVSHVLDTGAEDRARERPARVRRQRAPGKGADLSRTRGRAAGTACQGPRGRRPDDPTRHPRRVAAPVRA
ncbi:MAG TPA: hypothetical protein VKV21_00485 [Solirubrobacteraceae bacterium]|nr:hypothetical protein [Solirubrobacteraceae bacterium]